MNNSLMELAKIEQAKLDRFCALGILNTYGLTPEARAEQHANYVLAEAAWIEARNARMAAMPIATPPAVPAPTTATL